MTLEEFLAEWNNSKPTVLVHTSGSTGKPKPLLIEKQRMLNSAKITCDFLGLKQGDKALLCMPLDFIAGKMMVVRGIERGMKIINVKPSGHPLSDEALRSANDDDEITFAAMIPLQVANSLEVPKERERLLAIKHLIIGGGAVDDEMADTLKAFPNAVWSTYGMTETLSHVALRRLSGKDASSWYEPFESVEIATTDDGCLVINAPLVCQAMLTTNDRVEISKNVAGKTIFRVLGRKDNVINSGGVKIQIEEVEALLKPMLTKPYIITKRNDTKFGEVVVLLTENENITEVETICKQILPKYWQPKLIKQVASIPMTATGKPARAQAFTIASNIEKIKGKLLQCKSLPFTW
ncbi:AMP-binding protein [Prevotella bivia]|uniref:AMP-binding protein n=1 Tax=Prevotella bivia TaxID=28125 RepID=UPI00068FAD28|nr:AMP-binding protein [Prevotella bivia]